MTIPTKRVIKTSDIWQAFEDIKRQINEADEIEHNLVTSDGQGGTTQMRQVMILLMNQPGRQCSRYLNEQVDYQNSGKGSSDDGFLEVTKGDFGKKKLFSMNKNNDKKDEE